MKPFLLSLSLLAASPVVADGQAPWLAYLQPFAVDDGWDASTVRDVLDMNNDGRWDFAGIDGTGAYVSLSTTSGFSDMKPFSKQTGFLKGPLTSDVHKPVFADMNGDGFPDVVSFGTKGVYVGLSNGSKFGKLSLWSTEFRSGPAEIGILPNVIFVDEGVVAVDDFNGDKKDDLIVWVGTRLHLSLSSGKALQPGSVVFNDNVLLQPLQSDGFYISDITDLNGDGASDILGEYHFFDPKKPAASKNSFAMLIDLPSKPSLQFVDAETPPAVIEVGKFTSTTDVEVWTIGTPGRSLGCTIVKAPTNDIGCAGDFALNKNAQSKLPSFNGDFDGDGLEDVAYFTGKNFNVVHKNALTTSGTGQKQLTNKQTSNWMRGDWADEKDVNDLDTYPVFVGDMDGDKIDDFVRFGDSGVSISLSWAGTP